MFGDPHVYTFDHMDYTFNGKGEYVLVRADSPRVKLDVQVNMLIRVDWSPRVKLDVQVNMLFKALIVQV